MINKFGSIRRMEFVSNLRRVFRVRDIPKQLFWFSVAMLVLVRYMMTSGLAIQMIYAPHDDMLYVSRAYYMLHGEGMGPYDARTLAKLPGMSFWLAGLKQLGIPYAQGMLSFYMVACLYFVSAIRELKFSRILALLVFLICIFNPMTFDPQWYRVMREPLSTSLLFITFGALIYSSMLIRNGDWSKWYHLVALAVSLSLAIIVREEDQLLWGLLVMAVIFLVFDAWLVGQLRRRRVAILAVLILPAMSILMTEKMAENQIEKWYGLPILHDFSEGEFPRLVAAIRSVNGGFTDRHVMVSQTTLATLRENVESFRPVIDRLPPPGPDSYSCYRFQVCDEWTNGWMLFWIKDAAHAAGLTPNVIEGQAYFRTVREEIEEKCTNGVLNCKRFGNGLLPRFQLVWLGNYLVESIGILEMMFLPGFGQVQPPPLKYPVSVEVGRIFQEITLTPRFDSLAHSGNDEAAWDSYPKNTYLSLKYWLRYPDIAMAEAFSLTSGGEENGALTHYKRHGQFEGRVWEEGKKSIEDMKIASPLAELREPVHKIYADFSIWLIVAGVASWVFLVIRGLMARRLDLFLLVATAFVGFTSLRLAGLSYVSVYMGSLDGRLFFSTYVFTLALCPLLLSRAAAEFQPLLAWAKRVSSTRALE